MERGERERRILASVHSKDPKWILIWPLSTEQQLKAQQIDYFYACECVRVCFLDCSERKGREKPLTCVTRHCERNRSKRLLTGTTFGRSVVTWHLSPIVFLGVFSKCNRSTLHENRESCFNSQQHLSTVRPHTLRTNPECISSPDFVSNSRKFQKDGTQLKSTMEPQNHRAEMIEVS